jgi:hypothetical protein
MASACSARTGREVIRDYTGEKLAANVDWHRRRGFAIETRETLANRTSVHMTDGSVESRRRRLKACHNV